MDNFIKKEHKRLYENFDLAMECIEEIIVIAKKQQNYEICKPIEEFLKVYTNV